MAQAWPLLLASHPTHPDTGLPPHPAPSQAWLSREWGLGWACWGTSSSGRERQTGCTFGTAQWSAQRWLQEELPPQEEGRRSAFHIRPCPFLPDAVERWPSTCSLLGGVFLHTDPDLWGWAHRHTGAPLPQARGCRVKQPIVGLAVFMVPGWINSGSRAAFSACTVGEKS